MERVMSDLVPVVKAGTFVSPIAGNPVPTLIAAAARRACWRYVDFFTANIRNPNTRRAYARACGTFLAWCDERGRALGTIRPYDVSLYIESRQQTHSAPDVKQQLAAIRMLFDWLITGQVLPHNPAAAVRSPKHVVKTGKTPVLEGKVWRKLLDAMPTETVRDLRDRARIATHTYSFARIGAALNMRVEDSPTQGRRLAGAAARERRQAAHDALPSRARRGAAGLQ
jgi:site-specific recombinase XerD